MPKAALVVVGGLAVLAGIGACAAATPARRRRAVVHEGGARVVGVRARRRRAVRAHALSGEGFFDAFTFFNGSDPSHGTVECVPGAVSRASHARARSRARSAPFFSLVQVRRQADRARTRLISTNATTGEVRFGADSSEERGWVTVWRDGADYGYWPGGRKSVRLESRASFEGGLSC